MSKFLSKLIDQYPDLKYALLEAQTFNPDHYGFPPIYYKIMETDQERVDTYRDAFKKYNNLKGKIVCEVGVAHLGIDATFFATCKKAYLIENNPDLVPFIKKRLKAEGWDKKVELIVGDAMKIELPEKVDFIIGELMSIFCANEYQVQIFQHLRKFLKPNGKLIPDKIINLLQLGYVEFDKGINHYPVMFTRHLPTLMSLQKPVNTINLYKEKAVPVVKKMKIKCLMSGKLNCVYLNSWVQCADGANFTGTDSLMPPTIVKLKRAVKVKVGETVILNLKFEYGTSLDEAEFRVEKIK